jgi:phosphatidylglycerophosphate synthase
MRDIYFALGGIAVLAVTVVAYLIRLAVRGRTRFDRTEADGGSVFLGKRAMEMGYWLLDPVVDGLIALRVTPNMVTAFSLLPALGAGVAMAFGWFGLACVLATVSTLSDIVDGVLARRANIASDAGEVFDAAVDRYGEFFFLGGLVFYYRERWVLLLLALAAIFGSFMVSYSTAKAEAMRITPPRGAMRRAERAVYLLVAAAFTSVTRELFANPALRDLPIVLATTIVAVVANVSVVRRLGATMVAIRRRPPEATAAVNGANSANGAPAAHAPAAAGGILAKRENPVAGR